MGAFVISKFFVCVSKCKMSPGRGTFLFQMDHNINRAFLKILVSYEL